MITVGFTKEFLRRLKKLPSPLQEVAFTRIESFRERENHRHLKVHKLHGKYKDFFGFLIDHKHRIMFEWISEHEALLHTIGDHSIYN